jgi:hypothetical protein
LNPIKLTNPDEVASPIAIAPPIIGAESSSIYVPELLDKPELRKTSLRIFVQRVAQVLLGLVVSVTPILLLFINAVWPAIGILAAANVLILIFLKLMGDSVIFEVYLWGFVNLVCVMIMYYATNSAWVGLLALAVAWFFWS